MASAGPADAVALPPEGLRAPDLEVGVDPDGLAGAVAAGADVVALVVTLDGDSPDLEASLSVLGAPAAALVVDVLAPRRFTAAVGELLELPWPTGAGVWSDDVGASGAGRLLVLVGAGEGRPRDLRRAGAALGRLLRGRHHVAAAWPRPSGATAEAFVEGLVLGGFDFRIVSREQPPAPVGRLTLLGGSVPQDPPVSGRLLGRAAWLSRALAVTPSNVKSPGWLVQQAVDVARERGLECEVWDAAALERGGFGGLLGVGRASQHDPAMVRLAYRPPGAARRTPHVVLVGKGITFDTGGLSLKPSESMATMKRDMTGAGVVLAVMDSLAELGCPVRVTGLLAVAENSVGGDALRPGDVLHHYGGRTTEVTNTDAEGRLVLADAMAYAVDALAPTTLVDVATLTGAVRVALGQRTGGLFTPDDDLAARLLAAGEAAGEPLWRLPLAEDYEERIESKVADADNAGGSPGAITAALFLRHFAGDVPWAHLDLASVGDSPEESFEWTQGATGFGARLLLRWLRDPEGRSG